MNKKQVVSIILFLLFILLTCINFIVGGLTSKYSYDSLNFIALEFFNEERFYVCARGIGTILYFQYLAYFFLGFVFIYSIFCYWLYSKYQGWKFFLIISNIFVVYFLLLRLFVFKAYKLHTLLLHFPAFWLMYIEIILLYRIRNKF